VAMLPVRNKHRVGRAAAITCVATLLAAGATGCARVATAQVAADRFVNPLLPSGPDPWVLQYRGVYYYTHTLGNRIALWRTRDITDLRRAEQRTVWTPPATGPNAHMIWAPELHRIDGKWYLYYSATASGFSDDAHRGVFVLENGSADPLQGRWIDRGRVETRHRGIDGTVFANRGQLYFAYSPYIGGVSGIALAKMANPWTISGEEVVIAKADRPFEDQGGRHIMEGPEFLEGPTGRLFLTYSAGACWSDNYALGRLRARPGGDLLDPLTWTKDPEPVLSAANGVYATGHNGFFKSPDGREDWVIYHANPAPQMKCTAKRAPRIARITWHDGSPDFPAPEPAGSGLQKPSGTQSDEP